MTHHQSVTPILTRESDGLRFEPCYHPGMVRCEACLELVEPSTIREHICIEWWKPEYQATRTDEGYAFPNKILRSSRR